jgi:two-component system chemotaxis response regulator CheB
MVDWDMDQRRIVVIGASAGGLGPLRDIIGALPATFAAPVCVVLHASSTSPGFLNQILARAGDLPAGWAEDGLRLQPGRVYLAPRDHHLLVEPGVLRLGRGPKEHRFRPAVDPLFRSAAQVYGPGAVGVILSGQLNDGSSGLRVIKRLGGTAIVQDPNDAVFPSMPAGALRSVGAGADYVVPAAEIAPLLVRVTAEAPDQRPVEEPTAANAIEVRIAKGLNAIDSGVERIGDPSPYACPDCHGVMLRVEDETGVRFRCHTGHAYSSESLLAASQDGIESQLWAATRALEESGLLMAEMALRFDALGENGMSQRLTEQSAEAHAEADRLRKVVTAWRTPKVPA